MLTESLGSKIWCLGSLLWRKTIFQKRAQLKNPYFPCKWTSCLNSETKKNGGVKCKTHNSICMLSNSDCNRSFVMLRLGLSCGCWSGLYRLFNMLQDIKGEKVWPTSIFFQTHFCRFHHTSRGSYVGHCWGQDRCPIAYIQFHQERCMIYCPVKGFDMKPVKSTI